MSEQADIVELVDLAALVEKRERDYSKPRCDHTGRVIVDTDRRQLECKECGAMVDPLTWVAGLATDRVRWQREMDWRRKQREGTSVHAPGIGGDLLRCKAQPGGRWTVTISNRPESVTCTQCHAR